MNLASILDGIGVPWPDADSGKAREAAQAWQALAKAAQDAMSDGDRAAAELTANNTGPAIQAFAKYWSTVGGSDACAAQGDTYAMLLVLIDACCALEGACNKFADLVDGLKSGLEEKAGEIAAATTGGVLTTALTFGLSDVASGAVDSLIGSWATGAIEIFGVSVEDICATALAGGIAGGIGTLVSQTLTNSIDANFGGKPPSTSTTLEGLVNGIVTGAFGGVIGKLATGAANTGATAAMANLPDSASTLIPDLPGILAGIPDALDTRAAKLLIGQYSGYAAKTIVDKAEGTNASPPTVESILGGILDAKIQASAAQGPSEDDNGEKR